MDGVIIIFHSLMIMPASLFFHRDEIKWCNDGFRLAAFQAKVIKYKFNIFVVRNCNWQDNWAIRHSNLCFMTIYTILWQFLTIFLSLLRHQVFKWLPLSVRWSVLQQRRFFSLDSWFLPKITWFCWHKYFFHDILSVLSTYMKDTPLAAPCPCVDINCDCNAACNCESRCCHAERDTGHWSRPRQTAEPGSHGNRGHTRHTGLGALLSQPLLV